MYNRPAPTRKKLELVILKGDEHEAAQQEYPVHRFSLLAKAPSGQVFALIVDHCRRSAEVLRDPRHKMAAYEIKCTRCTFRNVEKSRWVGLMSGNNYCQGCVNIVKSHAVQPQLEEHYEACHDLH